MAKKKEEVVEDAIIEEIPVEEKEPSIKDLLRGILVEELSKDTEPVQAMEKAEASLEVQKLREDAEKYYSELVPFKAFKDRDKYKDDLVVGINGKIWRIKRGVQVMIPRAVYDIIAQSEEQDLVASDYMEAQQEAFVTEAKARKML